MKVYDADDLAAWLVRAPGVHLWVSILIGTHPEGATDISNFWEDWAEATNPRTNADLVVSGRQAEADHILGWLGNDPSSLVLQADSREEALTFFAATLMRQSSGEVESYVARSIVVDDVISWRI